MGLFGTKPRHGRPVALGQIVYRSYPERSAQNDTHNAVYPTPFMGPTDTFQTFWFGNRIPPTGINTGQTAGSTNPAHRYRVNVYQPDPHDPQLKGSGFNRTLGQLQLADVLAQMRQLWSNASGMYGGPPSN